MAGTAVHLLGIEQGNATMLSQSYNISSDPTDPVSWLANAVKKINLYIAVQLFKYKQFISSSFHRFSSCDTEG